VPTCHSEVEVMSTSFSAPRLSPSSSPKRIHASRRARDLLGLNDQAVGQSVAIGAGRWNDTGEATCQND